MFAAIRAAFAAAQIPGVIVVALAILIIGAVFVFALAALGGERNTGGRAFTGVSAQDQKNVDKVGAYAGITEAIEKITNDPKNFDAAKAIKSLKDTKAKPGVLNEQGVSIADSLIEDLTGWERASIEEHKQILKKFTELRNILLPDCGENGQSARQAVLSNPKIILNSDRGTYTNSFDIQAFRTGVFTNIAGNQFPMNPRMPCFLLFLANQGGFKMAKFVFAREHLITTTQTKASAHSYGNAVDIFSINNVAHARKRDSGRTDENNRITPEFDDQACAMLKFIKDNITLMKQKGIAPKQVFGPQSCAAKVGYSSYGRRGEPGVFSQNFLDGHNSHVHVGF